MTTSNWHLSEDRFFDPDPTQRRVARELYAGVAGLPIISPHGHVDPRLLADENASFGTPADLFIIPDHYVFRMLYSQGVPLEALGVPRRTAARWSPTIARSGSASPSTIICSAAPPAAPGSTTRWLRSSASGRSRRPRTPKPSTTSSRPNWRPPNSGRGRCSSASTSRCWPPPTPRPTRWPTIGRWPSRAGTAASSPPSAPTRW